MLLHPLIEDNKVLGVFQVFITVDSHDIIEDFCMDISKAITWTLCNIDDKNMNTNYVSKIKEKFALFVSQREYFEVLRNESQKEAEVFFCIYMHVSIYATMRNLFFLFIHFYLMCMQEVLKRLYIHMFMYKQIKTHKHDV